MKLFVGKTMVLFAMLLCACDKDNQQPGNNNGNNSLDKGKLLGYWYPDLPVLPGGFYTPKSVYFGPDSLFIMDLSNLGQGQYSGKWYWLTDSTVYTTITVPGSGQSSSNMAVRKLTADSLHGFQSPPGILVKSHR